MEGALETSVERPDSISWTPSEAKPTVLVGGEISSPLLGTEGPSWRGSSRALLHCGPPGRKLLEETITFLGSTGEVGTPVCKVDVTVQCFVWADEHMVAPEKFLRVRNRAKISRWLMCHEKWWSFHRPWFERPSRIAPQPVRKASVVSILRRHEAPNTGPWYRNQGFFHITMACKHRRLTLIMRKGLPLGENPLVLSHHCRCLMYNSPNGITLDAAAKRPNSLWNCLTVSDWPSLILFTADRMDSICADDRRACMMPTDATEQESTNRRCS